MLSTGWRLLLTTKQQPPQTAYARYHATPPTLVGLVRRISVPSTSSANGVVAFDLTNEVKWTGKESEYQQVAVRVDGHGTSLAGVVSSVFVLREA